MLTDFGAWLAAITAAVDVQNGSARMEMLCAEFGTRLMRRDDRLVWQADK